MTALYVLVNDRLSKSQRIPQAAHAVAEFMHKHGSDPDVVRWVENDRTMVCLRNPENWLTDMQHVYPRTAEFRDSDLGNMLTAVAIGPIEREQGQELFGSLQLA